MSEVSGYIVSPCEGALEQLSGLQATMDRAADVLIAHPDQTYYARGFHEGADIKVERERQAATEQLREIGCLQSNIYILSGEARIACPGIMRASNVAIRSFAESDAWRSPLK